MTPDKLVKIIGITIGLFPLEISELLTKNGIVVDAQNLDTDGLVEATFSGLNKSIAFRNDFDALYNQNESLISYALGSSSEYSNLTGSEWTSIGTSVVGGLGSFFGSQNNLKSAQAQADAIRKQAEAQKEVALIQMETERLKAQAGLNAQKPTTGGNTMLYVALGVGAVVVLGVVIFAVTRKKA